MWHTDFMASVSVFAQDLSDLLETKVSGRTIHRVASAFHTAGQWSPRDPVDKYGNCLLTLWLDKVFSNHGVEALPDEETLSFLLDGRSLSEMLDVRPRPHGRSLREWLFHALEESRQSRVMDFLWSGQIVGSLSDEELRGFSSKHDVDHPDGNEIFRLALSKDRVEAVKSLLDRGWGWTDSSGQSMGVHISSEEAWGLFLDTGGDPFSLVKSPTVEDEGQIKPLWRHLLETPHFSNTNDTAYLERWAQENAGQQMEQKEIEDYWKRLERRHTLQEVMQAIRGRKDWPHLTKGDGANVLMVGMDRHIGVFDKLAAMQKAKDLFSHVDNDGWSIWHYLISVGPKVSDGMWKVAIKHAPVRPDPESGLLVSLLSKVEKLDQQIFPTKEALQGVLNPNSPGAPTQEDWWAGTPSQLEKLGRYLQGDPMDPYGRTNFYWGSASSQTWGAAFSAARSAERLSALAHAVPPPLTAPPSVLGGVALNELMTAHTRSSSSERFCVCDEMIAAGASIRLSDRARERVEKALPTLPDGCSARFEQLRLNASLAPVTPSSRPRPRL